MYMLFMYWPALREIKNCLSLLLRLSHHLSSSCCGGRCVWWAWCRAAPLRRRVLGRAPALYTSRLVDLTAPPAWAYMQMQSSNQTGMHAGRNPEPSSCEERKIILINLYETISNSQEHRSSEWVCVWPVRARERVDVCSVPEVGAGLQDEVSRAVGEHLYIVWEEIKRSVTWTKQHFLRKQEKGRERLKRPHWLCCLALAGWSDD